MARTSQELKHRGITAFLVERGSPGLKIGKTLEKMGHPRLGHGRAEPGELRACPRRTASRMKGTDFASRCRRSMEGGSACAAQALGIAQASLDAAGPLRPGARPVRKPISEFQAIQWMIADMKAADRGARLLTLRAAWLKDQGLPHGPGGVDREAHRLDRGPRGRRPGRADPRRIRLHEGIRRRAVLPRREGDRALRGNLRDPADRDRQLPAAPQGRETRPRELQSRGAQDDPGDGGPGFRRASWIWPTCGSSSRPRS
mgnify:CR=1 FL=1